MTFLVKATQIGFYGDSKKQPGEKFTLDCDSDFEPTWMVGMDRQPEVVEAPQPKKSKSKKVDKKNKKSESENEAKVNADENDGVNHTSGEATNSTRNEVSKPLHQMSVQELLRIAEETGLDVDPEVNRGDLIKLLKNQE